MRLAGWCPFCHIAEFVLYCRLLPNHCTILNYQLQLNPFNKWNEINIKIGTLWNTLISLSLPALVNWATKWQATKFPGPNCTTSPKISILIMKGSCHFFKKLDYLTFLGMIFGKKIYVEARKSWILVALSGS